MTGLLTFRDSRGAPWRVDVTCGDGENVTLLFTSEAGERRRYYGHSPELCSWHDVSEAAWWALLECAEPFVDE